MISYLSRLIVRLLPQLGSRIAIAVAIGVCLSMFAATAPAQSTRPFQMTILGSTERNGFYTSAGVDIPVFFRGHVAYDLQPAGPSILWTAVNANLDAIDGNNYHLIDWSRIVAVYVDEPYDSDFMQGHSVCPPPTPDPTDNETDLGQKIADRNADLSRVADAVRRKAPHARFWVNFTAHEIELIQYRMINGCDLNKPYIDVISMDIYGVAFNNAIRDRYEDLYRNHRHSPYQQFALVPGTYSGGSPHRLDASQAQLLHDFFAYATTMNQQCDLPLGPTRITGFHDRCPVWMVAGFLGGRQPYQEGGATYYPIDLSPNVLATWQDYFSLPKVDPAKARTARELIPLLSDESKTPPPEPE